jgi:hypothetical protein
VCGGPDLLDKARSSADRLRKASKTHHRDTENQRKITSTDRFIAEVIAWLLLRFSVPLCLCGESFFLVSLPLTVRVDQSLYVVRKPVAGFG